MEHSVAINQGRLHASISNTLAVLQNKTVCDGDRKGRLWLYSSNTMLSIEIKQQLSSFSDYYALAISSDESLDGIGFARRYCIMGPSNRTPGFRCMRFCTRKEGFQMLKIASIFRNLKRVSPCEEHGEKMIKFQQENYHAFAKYWWFAKQVTFCFRWINRCKETLSDVEQQRRICFFTSYQCPLSMEADHRSFSGRYMVGSKILRRASSQFDSWIGAFKNCAYDRLRVEASVPHFRSLHIGFHWPSLAWANESLKAVPFGGAERLSRAMWVEQYTL